MRSISQTILMVAALAAASPMLMGGCTTLDTVAAHEQTVRSVINIATLAAIEKSEDRAATALKVVEAAEDARKWMDFDGVTMAQISAKARQRIAQSDADLSKKAALNALVDIAEAQIAAAITHGELTPEQKITVNKLLDWIIQSASAYAA